MRAQAAGPVIPTTLGGMWPVNTDFCTNLPQKVATTVEVPPLTWGVSGANITIATAPFMVQLLDDSNPAVPVPIDTLDVIGGMEQTSPPIQRVNYAGRPAALRVIRDPRFPFGKSIIQTTYGCFTEPGTTQPLEPAALRIVVDTTDAVFEGEFETDNELRLP